MSQKKEKKKKDKNMTDQKYRKIVSLKLGYDATHMTTILNLISWKDKLMSPEGELVKPWAAINDKTPSDVTHQHRFYLVEYEIDGLNYEAIFTQQVKDGVATSRALRQGADNDPIGYHVADFLLKDAGTATITYETTRSFLSSLHIHVSNRKGVKYNPVTIRFKVRGNRTET